jgi:hypothetical protein
MRVRVVLKNEFALSEGNCNGFISSFIAIVTDLLKALSCVARKSVAR